MNVHRYSDLLSDRTRHFDDLKAKLTAVAERHGERLLVTPHNGISMAITLGGGSIGSLTHTVSLYLSIYLSISLSISIAISFSPRSPLSLLLFTHCTHARCGVFSQCGNSHMLICKRNTVLSRPGQAHLRRRHPGRSRHQLFRLDAVLTVRLGYARCDGARTQDDLRRRFRRVSTQSPSTEKLNRIEPNFRII